MSGAVNNPKPASGETQLVASGVSKHFGGVRAVEAVTLSVAVPADFAGQDYESYADHLLDHLAGAGLDLRERVSRRHLLTPDVLGPHTPPSLAGADGHFLAPPGRSALPGLHLIGATVHPGGGLARAGMSASITATVIGPA